MGCLFALLGAFFPRLVLVIVGLTSTFVGRAVPPPTALWWLLGFVFAPSSFLWFCAVQNWYGGRWGVLQIVVLVLALMSDFGSGGHGAREAKKRRKKRD